MWEIKCTFFSLFLICFFLVTPLTYTLGEAAIWEEIEIFLQNHRIDGTIKKLVQDEIRTGIPTIEYLRMTKKEEEMKRYVLRLKKSYVRQFDQTDELKKKSLGECLKELYGLENKYQSFLKSYDVLFEKLQNPLMAVS